MPLFPCIFHGVGYIGGICTTLNPLYSVEEMQSQLQDSNAIMMVTVQPLLEKALKSVEGSGVKKIFVLGLKDQEEQVGNDKCQVLDAKVLLKTPKSTEMIYDRKINPKEDLVVLPYSSGTTGLCKCCSSGQMQVDWK